MSTPITTVVNARATQWREERKTYIATNNEGGENELLVGCEHDGTAHNGRGRDHELKALESLRVLLKSEIDDAAIVEIEARVLALNGSLVRINLVDKMIENWESELKALGLNHSLHQEGVLGSDLVRSDEEEVNDETR